MNLIQSDPTVMMGKPVIAGTRITVELVLEKLAAGETIEQILKAHPRLTRESVSAVLAYAAQAVRESSPKEAAGSQGVITQGERMAAALEQLAALDTLSEISDPSAWQREQRQDRSLPDRDA